MDTQTHDLPPKDHNQPDEYQIISDRVASLAAAANTWLNKVKEIDSEDLAGRASDFSDQINEALKQIEKKRKAEKQPYIDAGKAVDEKYTGLKNILETAKNLLRPKLTAYLMRKEQERREATRRAEEEALRKLQEEEEARRLAEADTGDVVGNTIRAEQAAKEAEAAIKEAERTAKARVGVKGDYGTRSRGLRTVWKARITDHDKAFEHFRDHPKVRELIEQLAAAAARSPEGRAKPIPGVEFVEEQVAA